MPESKASIQSRDCHESLYLSSLDISKAMGHKMPGVLRLGLHDMPHASVISVFILGDGIPTSLLGCKIARIRICFIATLCDCRPIPVGRSLIVPLM